MAIRSILVAYDGAPGAESALRSALSLARAREARIVGVLAHGVARARSHLAPWLTDELDAMLRKQEASARAEIGARFRAALGTKDAARADFVDVAGDPTSAIVDYARTVDLVVMGRFDPQPGAEHFSPSPDVVALQCGRPVLIVPPGHEGEARFASAVLAWDARRAAARALGDAIHLLEAGARVAVASVGEEEAAFRQDRKSVV